MSYNTMFPNSQFYMQDLQNMRDKIDMQMRQFQQPMPNPNQQTPAINQTFQLSNPQQNNNDFDGKYVAKEMTILWFKDAAGNIKSYSLAEIIELDEKDKKIIELQRQIEELKGVVINAKSDTINVDESTTRAKSSNVQNNKSSSK